MLGDLRHSEGLLTTSHLVFDIFQYIISISALFIVHSGSKSYQRHQLSRETLNVSASKAVVSLQDKAASEGLKKLRFNRHVSAFDIDLNALEEHPWRNKNVDILDYFNYGFNEKTWMVEISIYLALLLS